MNYFAFIVAFSFHFIGFSQKDALPKSDQSIEIPVLWKSISSSDYRFHEEWSYPLGVYVNQSGQVSCDGFCPIEVDVMKDDQGRIYDDSLPAFYQIVDTTHLPHTIHCTSTSMYEFAGTDFIHFTQHEGQLIGITEGSPATHSMLSIRIKESVCSASVRYLSIVSDRPEMIFAMNNGRMILDPIAYEQGIIKGFFDFRFQNDFEPTVPLQWSGFLYAPIESEED